MDDSMSSLLENISTWHLHEQHRTHSILRKLSSQDLGSAFHSLPLVLGPGEPMFSRLTVITVHKSCSWHVYHHLSSCPLD